MSQVVVLYAFTITTFIALTLLLMRSLRDKLFDGSAVVALSTLLAGLAVVNAVLVIIGLIVLKGG